MIKDEYKKQVQLLLKVLPEVGKESNLALHGGTAINLFIRNMPRLSVDIDLTYLPLEDFETSKSNINAALQSHARPIDELLSPNWQDQKQAMEMQFEGMTNEEFNYNDYEQTRVDLLHSIHNSLSESDKKFLLDFKNLNPDWKVYPFQHFPGIAWKIENLKKLKENNPEKHSALLELLKQSLYQNSV